MERVTGPLNFIRFRLDFISSRTHCAELLSAPRHLPAALSPGQPAAWRAAACLQAVPPGRPPCSERSDEVRVCKLRITHILKLAQNTDFILHIKHTKTQTSHKLSTANRTYTDLHMQTYSHHACSSPETCLACSILEMNVDWRSDSSEAAALWLACSILGPCPILECYTPRQKRHVWRVAMVAVTLHANACLVCINVWFFFSATRQTALHNCIYT